MTHREGPAWLAALQERFATVITTPLDRSALTLRAQSEGYPADAVADVTDGAVTAARERLAVYNRQYWFRLFTVLQQAFPVTSRAMTYWAFNEHAARFIVEHPPHHWDIDRVADGFEAFFERALPDGPSREMWLEAARLDAAWRALFRAPPSTPFQASPEIAARLLDARLESSPSVAVLRERWPWLEWKAVAARSDDRPLALPPALAAPRWWALVREREGVLHVPLEPREGELLSLLREHTVRDALAKLEAVCSKSERDALPANAQRWLARGAQRGFWRSAVVDGYGITHE